MSAIVKKKDYEHYEIPVPVKCIIGKKRKSYLFEELEKRHPCYSEEFCFDESLIIRKKRLFLDVVVINKLKLMMYKNKNPFSMFGIKFESLKGKRKFHNKKIELMLGIFATVLLILFMYLIQWAHKNQKKQEVIIIENNLSEDEKDEVYFPGEAISRFIEITEQKKGYLSNLNLRTDGYEEYLKVKVKNVYPEDYKDLISDYNGVIEYENEMPSFLIDKKWRLTVPEDSKKISKAAGFYTLEDVRKEIKLNGRIIQEKNNNQIKFVCREDLSVLNGINDILKEAGEGIKEVSVDYIGNGEFSVEIKLDENLPFNMGINLKLFKNKEKLFRTEEKNKAIMIEKHDEIVTEKNSDLLMGKICFEGGKVLAFYKNQQGKLYKKMEEL